MGKLEADTVISYTTFDGRVENTGDIVVTGPIVILTFKLDGKVVALDYDSIQSTAGDVLFPGEVGVFHILVLILPEEYDEIIVTFGGRETDVDPLLLTGDLRVIEDGLSMVELANDTAIVGELINETNAVVTDVEVLFNLFSGEDDFLGAAVGARRSYTPDEIMPGEIVPFLARSDVRFGEAVR